MFTSYEIKRGYAALKRMAYNSYATGDIEGSIKHLSHADIVVSQLNWIYNDDEMNILVEKISASIFGNQHIDFQANNKRVIFFDQFGKSFILALQYMRALSKAGYEVLYILCDYVNAFNDTFIVEELKQNKIISEIIPSEWSAIEKAKKIHELTISFCPCKIFLHVKSFSAFNFALPAISKNCKKYYIDLGDHAFWIKNSNIDYIIAFRDFGATIEHEKRGFTKDQIFLVPYYPITDAKEFQGFPPIEKDKIILFTGGDYYKTFSQNNLYWTSLIEILKQNKNAVILYATKCAIIEEVNNEIQSLAQKHGVSDRLIPIGFRADINEVFANCDIYLGTFPMSGGLMSQYAAANSKPILQYYVPELAANNETEQVLCYNKQIPISFDNIKAYMEEAKRLIENNEYRKQKGQEINASMITREQFDDLLITTIKANNNQVGIRHIDINYKAIEKWWFSIEKKGYFNVRAYLMSLLGKQKLYIMPFSYLRTLISRIR